MSASREKKNRIDERKTVDPVLAQTKAKVDKRRKRVVGIVSGVIALILVIVIIYGSGVFHRLVPVITVDGESMYPAEYNYHFSNTKWYYYNTYGSYISFDPTLPLKNQTYAGGGSMFDMINDTTLSSVKSFLIKHKLALDEKTTLTDEDNETLKTNIDSIASAASNQGVTTQVYIDQYFGAGLTIDELKEYLSRELLVSRWETNKKESYTYSDSEIETYFQEHREDYERLSFQSMSFNGVLTEGTEEQQAQFYEVVKSYAEEMKEKVTEDNFNEIAVEYQTKMNDLKALYTETEADNEDVTVETEHLKVAGSTVSNADAKAWLFDTVREAGQTNLVEDTKVFTLYLYLNRERETGATKADIRHILFQFPDSATDEQKEETRVKAQEVLDLYLAGAHTEEAFGELAKEYSSDGNAADGGIYENIGRGQFVAPFENWMFDPARKAGDTGLVESTYGYHVMYFPGRTEGISWKDDVKDDMVAAAYETFYNEVDEKATSKVNNFGVYLAGIGK
jgi:parvulin-like peptidyl-prolyl isomerase